MILSPTELTGGPWSPGGPAGPAFPSAPYKDKAEDQFQSSWNEAGGATTVQEGAKHWSTSHP